MGRVWSKGRRRSTPPARILAALQPVWVDGMSLSIPICGTPQRHGRREPLSALDHQPLMAGLSCHTNRHVQTAHPEKRGRH
ncbi:hypothetical protein KC345_g63 [Hortaea werneckii]|nr:hypothetical protein KC345_g63 [Hortaea werneckii]